MRYGFALLLSGVVLASCASSGPAPESRVSARSTPPAVLQVDNQSWANFSIFVGWEGLQRRLGRSRSSSTTNFPIPLSIVGGGGRRIRFIADPIGARINSVSREIPVLPGDTIFLTIPPA